MCLDCRRFVEQQGSNMDYAVAVDSRGEAGHKLMGAAGKAVEYYFPMLCGMEGVKCLFLMWPYKKVVGLMRGCY